MRDAVIGGRIRAHANETFLIEQMFDSANILGHLARHLVAERVAGSRRRHETHPIPRHPNTEVNDAQSTFVVRPRFTGEGPSFPIGIRLRRSGWTLGSR